MIFSCSNKIKSEESVEHKPSGAGMTDEEIRNLHLDELVSLKNSISNYLKCRKLKNRNNEFIGLYMKINKEINIRNNNGVNVKKQIFETKVDKSPIIPKNNLSSSNLNTQGLQATHNDENVSKKNNFLKRKFSFSQSLLDIVFPSFLNDMSKQVYTNTQSAEKVEESSPVSSECYDDEKPMKKINIKKTKKCIKDFDQGLFNQKIDVNNDDLIINFISPSLEKGLSKKENEIKNTLFNEVPEDLFFELE